jgi:hypothetical protein
MSTPEQGPDSGLTVPEAKLDAAKALLVVQSLIASAEGRRAYKAGAARAFNGERDRRKGDFPGGEPQYEHIPDSSRRALESLSVQELEVLSSLDKTFVEDGLYVEVPDPGKLFFK